MASQGERLRMRRSVSHTIFRRNGTNNSPGWCIMFGFEWPLPWYVQIAFLSAAAGTDNVPAILLSLTGTPWTTGVPGRSNRSLTGPYWSSMLLLHLLAKLWAMPTLHGSKNITAVVVSHGSHSELASWVCGRYMHYISGRLEIWVESAALFNSLVEHRFTNSKKKKKVVGKIARGKG